MLSLVLGFLSHLAEATGSTTDPHVATMHIDTSRVRTVPRFGFGNELVLQSTNDSNVVGAAAGSGSTMARYPGGTPSDYWLWDEGWIRPGSPCAGHLERSVDLGPCGNYPERRTTPAQWARYLKAAKISDSVFDLCQLSCNLTYELAGLRAHAAAGIPIRFVELGNEMYDSSRADVMARYPQPRDYAVAMLPWVEAIKHEFPAAQVLITNMLQ